MYDLLLDVFVSLPGDALLSEIKDGRLDALLPANTAPDGQRIHEGARLVTSFLLSTRHGSPGILMNELLVDKTRLLRATGQKNFRPPYERLYAAGPARDGFLLQALNRFYRRAGLLLEQESCESPDFLFIELDFMKQLCLREIEESLSRMPTEATRAMEQEFLRRHLGSWAKRYCVEAEKHAQTRFYRGFLAVLDGFVSAETSRLDERFH